MSLKFESRCMFYFYHFAITYWSTSDDGASVAMYSSATETSDMTRFYS